MGGRKRLRRGRCMTRQWPDEPLANLASNHWIQSHCDGGQESQASLEVWKWGRRGQQRALLSMDTTRGRHNQRQDKRAHFIHDKRPSEHKPTFCTANTRVDCCFLTWKIELRTLLLPAHDLVLERKGSGVFDNGNIWT